MRLAGARRLAPRAIAEELAEHATTLPSGRARRDRRPRVRQPLAGARLVRGRARRAAGRRRCVRRRFGVRERADSGRDGVGEPDRPDRRRRRRATAPTATRLRACSSSRATRSSGSTTTTTPARRWNASAPLSRHAGEGRSRPRTATTVRTSPIWLRCADDPVPLMLTQIEHTLERFRIHYDSWALQSELEQRLPEFLPRLDTYEKDGAVWARSSAYGDDDDRVLIRSETGTPTYRAADVVYLADKLDRGHRPRDLRPRRRPPRHAQLVRRGGTDARLRPRARRGAALPARPPEQGWRGGEDVQASRRRRDARRVPRRGRSRRGALVPRLARARPDDRDRRRSRRREDGEEPRLLRPVRPCPDRRDPPQRRGRGA